MESDYRGNTPIPGQFDKRRRIADLGARGVENREFMIWRVQDWRGSEVNVRSRVYTICDGALSVLSIAKPPRMKLRRNLRQSRYI